MSGGYMNIDESDINNINDVPVVQNHEFKCCRCGYPNFFVKPISFVDYKLECKRLESEIQEIIANLNSLLSYTERNYHINPAKDKFIEMLTKLRDRHSS